MLVYQEVHLVEMELPVSVVQQVMSVNRELKVMLENEVPLVNRGLVERGVRKARKARRVSEVSAARRVIPEKMVRLVQEENRV
jgi:hypothetical protein